MWPELVQTAKEGGADVIESYVFWNGHELSPGKVSNTNVIHKIFSLRFLRKFSMLVILIFFF